MAIREVADVQKQVDVLRVESDRVQRGGRLAMELESADWDAVEAQAQAGTLVVAVVDIADFGQRDLGIPWAEYGDDALVELVEALAEPAHGMALESGANGSQVYDRGAVKGDRKARGEIVGRLAEEALHRASNRSLQDHFEYRSNLPSDGHAGLTEGDQLALPAPEDRYVLHRRPHRAVILLPGPFSTTFQCAEYEGALARPRHTPLSTTGTQRHPRDRS